MKVVKIVILLLLCHVGCNGQEKCQTVSLGDLFSVLTANTRNALPVKYVKFKDFDFKIFKPLDGSIDQSNFYEIGYDKSGSITEIIHFQKLPVEVKQKILVSEDGNFRVLKYQIEDNGKYYFLPIAIFMMKIFDEKHPRNFMINTLPLFGDENNIYRPGKLYTNFPISDVKSISVIMILNDELFPVDIFKLYEGNVVFHSQVYYTASNLVDYEFAGIYYKKTDDLTITESTCISQLMFHKTNPDMTLSLHPKVNALTKVQPLWIRGGAHEYE
ncbi:hypothetical protein ACFQ21_05295 [Ohtaekwangia kribbensis]|uniref:Uncharacterized protein n=1 Tax=Ohtaekwangia kribbensis TaxID=688913 RepID=A0ABW3JYV0_9BACT